jgi:16S rRNA (cytidine1402-2'-O)-methyltransferase
MAGTLYIVPTPIGNLEDITLRAVRILKESDAVVCEDTRETVKLLNHYQINKPLISCYTQNQERRIPGLISRLAAGETLAVVSDSGTPGISDPGAYLIRAALDARLPVVPLPGPCAAVTALVAAGLPTDSFVFIGFLKRKPGKLKKELQVAAAAGSTVVFYESPHRIAKTLTLCAAVFPAATPVVIARELTKKFEEYIRGTLGEVVARVQAQPLRGELVVLIAPLRGHPEERKDEEDEHAD